MRCMVGLLGGGCGEMERGCVGVGSLKGMVKGSGGVVGFSIEKWGGDRGVWWMSYEIGLCSTKNREVG